MTICDSCGRVSTPPRVEANDVLPAGIEPCPAAPTLHELRDPYRDADGVDRPVDVVVTFSRRALNRHALGLACFAVTMGFVVGLPILWIGIVMVGCASAIAISLIPSPAQVRVLATKDRLAIAPFGAPLRKFFEADDVAAIFVRAKARADRPEDRRFELLLVDTDTAMHRLIDDSGDASQLLWISTNVERLMRLDDEHE
jgi:hypothetical protein